MGRFFSAIDAASEVQAFEATSFIASGDQVIVMGTQKVRAKRTDRSYETHWIHAMTLKNGNLSVERVRRYGRCRRGVPRIDEPEISLAECTDRLLRPNLESLRDAADNHLAGKRDG